MSNIYIKCYVLVRVCACVCGSAGRLKASDKNELKINEWAYHVTRQAAPYRPSVVKKMCQLKNLHERWLQTKQNSTTGEPWPQREECKIKRRIRWCYVRCALNVYFSVSIAYTTNTVAECRVPRDMRDLSISECEIRIL